MRSDEVRRVKDRLDIVEIVGDYVRLKKAGNSYLGLCPFHDEKTPSFNVSPSRQTYHCFGCGRGGDVFSFLMERENLSFREALELLAERAGVRLSSGRGRFARERSLFDVMERACSYYRSMLEGHEGELASSYLDRRGLPREAWKRFELGYASQSWDGLWRALSEEGVSFKEAFDAGLVLEGRSGPYDRFRGRIIFPVRDISGRLLAFGGRLIRGEGAKYINSPEGVLYSKRRSLYLLHRGKEAARSRERLILVEGYTDAIRLHLCGFDETAASLGTALTEDQARLIRRLTDRCYICYDSDVAGQEAAIRGMYVLRKEGLDVNVVELPEGKDPDTLLSLDGGVKLFTRALEESRPLVLHHLHIRRDMLRSPDKRRRASEDIISGIAVLPPVDLSPYLPAVEAALGVLHHELVPMLEEERAKLASRREAPSREAESEPVEETSEATLDVVEAALCALLWRDATMRRTADPVETVSLICDPRLQTLASALLLASSTEELEGLWHGTGDTFPMRAIAAGDAYCCELEQASDAAPILLEILESRRCRREYDELKVKLSRGEASDDELRRFQELARQLKGGRGT
ncbi:MAG: DNA primase [Synergistaceae bacterium]|nr:DNA primase [Synergistota bacterium]NLM71130.1 DNA primase [Synergistaceae bacterium]